jgi:hypothetical protein
MLPVAKFLVLIFVKFGICVALVFCHLPLAFLPLVICFWALAISLLCGACVGFCRFAYGENPSFWPKSLLAFTSKCGKPYLKSPVNPSIINKIKKVY